MPRRARIQIPGYPMHIVQRGHNRAACFLEPSGYELYLGLLNELHERFKCQVHAFVLMTNHVHLLVTPGASDSASELLRRVNLRFVQAMNRRYGRTGGGWEGRFWSSVVENNYYFLATHRYIELNPVRAGLARRPESYRWSSHAANAFGAPCPFIRPHAEYFALGSNADRRRAAYRNLFREKLDDDELSRIRLALRTNRPLGSDAFIDELEARLGVRLRRARPGPKPRTSAAATAIALRA
jgi:putative transposase